MYKRYNLIEVGSDGLSGVISGLSFAQSSKKPNLKTSSFTDNLASKRFGKQAAMKNKFNAMRRKRIQEMLFPITEVLTMEDKNSDQKSTKNDKETFSSSEQLKANQKFYTNNLNQKSGMAIRYPWSLPTNVPPKTSDPKEQDNESGKNKSIKRKRIAEALGFEKDPTQRRMRSGQDNTPSGEVGVKGSQLVPTRELNDESGNNQRIDKKINKKKLSVSEIMPGDKQLISTNCGMESGRKKKLKEDNEFIDEGLLSWLKQKISNLFHRPKIKKEPGVSPEKKEYIWRTQEDDKVRDLHNELEGKQFSFDDPPISGTSGFRGNPGEPANCRCYAEPVHENINKFVEHLNKKGAKSCLFKYNGNNS